MSSLVSIIVPVYNVEEYLPQCIESLIGQSYENIEILLVDDGSKDNSGNICKEYALVDSRIKVFHKKNGGLSDARNYGLKYSQGDYISFVDSDDYVHPDFIYQLYSSIKDSDLSLCDFMSFTNMDEIKYVNNEIIVNHIDRDIYLRELVNLDKVKLVVAWNKLYRKSLWNDFSFVRDVLHEDEFAIHHIINKCNRIAINNRKLYFYRQRENSITSNKKNEKSFEDKLKAYYDRYIFYKAQSMPLEARTMLNHILYRCAMRTVKNDNSVWKIMGNVNNIFKANKLGFSVRILLLLKMWSYPLYQKIIALKP
jgi:glycosyltransferase involved in cell wall biosynthesis